MSFTNMLAHKPDIKLYAVFFHLQHILEQGKAIHNEKNHNVNLCRG